MRAGAAGHGAARGARAAVVRRSTWIDADECGRESAVIAAGTGGAGRMAVFARVLEATRANLNVMKRLRELRAASGIQRAASVWLQRVRRAAMGTINSALSLMTGALDADQAALNVVANNVANANTGRVHRGDAQLAGESANSIGGDLGWRRSDGDRRDLAARSGAGGAAGPAAATGVGIGHAADGAEQHAGAVYAGFGLVERGGRRYRQRHHKLFRLVFVARKRSHRQRAARAGAFVGVDAGRRYFECGKQPESRRARRSDQEASGVASQVNSLTGAIAQLNLRDSIHFAGRGRGNARRPAAAGSEPAFAVDRDQPGDDGEQRAFGHDNLGAVAGVGGTELSVDHGNGERGDGLFSEWSGYDGRSFASGGGQLGGYLTARDVDIPECAGLARSTGIRHFNFGECAKQFRHGSGWRDREPVANPLYIFNEPAQVAGSAAAMSVIDDRSQPDCGGGRGRRDRQTTRTPWPWRTWPRSRWERPTTSISLTQILDSAAQANGDTATGNVRSLRYARS